MATEQGVVRCVLRIDTPAVVRNGVKAWEDPQAQVRVRVCSFDRIEKVSPRRIPDDLNLVVCFC